MRFKKFTTWFLLFTIYFGTIAPVANTFAQRRPTRPVRQAMMNSTTNGGLEFRLSEGTEGAERREIQRLAEVNNLSEAEAAALLKRLPAIKAEAEDQQDFAKRAGSLPAPKTGKVVPVKFPADENRGTPKVANNAALEVLRFSPAGDVPIVADLSITFSQPMVAVTSQEQAAQVAPVRLTPEIKGRWRWLGTKTLIFDAEGRFPMATKFTATVPAGTKSALGNALVKDVSWSFTTPPPRVEQFQPNGGLTVRRDAVIFASFNQEINPQAVLEKMIVAGGNQKRIAVRLATQEEINADSLVSYYAKQAMPNRWLAFRAVELLPSDAQISVTFPVGTPSAEGPLTTTKAQSFGFKTYGAMKFVRAFCSYQNNPKCSPFEPWYLEFTNPIDAAAFAKDLVKIEPAFEGAQIYPSGNLITIQGYKLGRRAYKVTIAGALKDQFGQTLETAATATFNVGAAEPSLIAQGGSFVILDPTAKPNYSVYSINQPSLKVQVRSVSPEDWEAFRSFMRHLYYDEQKRPPLPGRVVFNETVRVENKPDEMVETRIDLSAALNEGFGNAIVFVEPTVKRDQYDRTKIVAWTQSTQIGLDAFVDNQELVGFATDLKTGKPLGGVEMRIYPNNGTALSKDEGGRVEDETSASRSWWEWLGFIGTSEENAQTETSENSTNLINSQTAADGLLRLALPDAQPNKQNVLIARRGRDVAFMPEQSDYFYENYGSWYKKSQSDYLKWFVFDDRGMYRPKEEVSIKGYIRKITAGKFGDVAELGDAARGGIRYTLKDARGAEITKGTANLNAFGAFDFKFKLPDNMNLGFANIELYLTGSTTPDFTHNFQVQEFRRPEFEVSAKNETEAPYLVGESANVSVEAKYYAGGALANAETNWTVTATPTNYTPPNRSDFTFGKWFPWWRSFDSPYGETTTQAFKGVTGADGKHVLKIDFVAANPPRPYNMNASASVQDVNRQTFAASTNLLVHPADLYIGIRTPRTFVNRGEAIKVESIVTDIDGKMIAGRDAKITAVLKDWQFDKGTWQQVTVDEQTCDFKSTEGIANCNFTAKQGGVYTITASVLDDRERRNESELTLWVSGGKTPPKRNVEMEEAQLVPDKKEYAPGDTAEILVNTPFYPAEGVLTLRREGLVKTERFTINEPSKVLRIPLEERYLPNIHAQVDLVGATERTNDAGEILKDAPKRPAFASGSLNLPISIASRKLTVAAEPAAKNLEPGGATTVNVMVKDARGAAVANSEVAVVVVDESVLALSGYSIADPASIFYFNRGAGTNDYHSRKDVLLGNQKDLIQNLPINGRATGDMALMEMSAGVAAPTAAPAKMIGRRNKSEARADMARDEESEDGQAAIRLRENFNALAVFAPSAKTDANGRVSVEVKLPDNLTRYRVTAISVTNGKQFGKGESNITARQPLMVRPSAPRFMNFGDRIQLPVVLQNQTDNPLTANVAVRATNAELTAGNGRSVVVPANDRVEVRFPVSAMKAGIARFQIATTSGKFADAAEISLPVWTPATTEAFATYGTTDANEAVIQPVQTPGDVFPQFGGLEVTTSSTQLQELTDAFIYLQTYPYECSEQVASRMISIAALRDVLTAFKADDMPKPEEITLRFAKDVEILKGRQREDGSFGQWGLQRQRYEFPYVSVHGAHALARARQKNYEVPKQMVERSLNYLKNIERHIPKEYSQEARWAIVSYALYVRNLLGEKDAAKARNLIQTATIQKLSMESLGWLLNVLNGDKTSDAQIEAITRHFMNRAVETAGAANFTESYTDGMEVLLHSNRRTDGIVLESLINNQPNNDLIPKLVRGLLANKTKGRWGNTQENVFILLALDRYFGVFEKATPNFVAQAWLGQAYAGEQPFRGRSVDSKQIDVPMSYLIEQNGASNLILNKTGEGRLYYRIGMKYAPRNLKLAPADYGFEVTRKYEAVDAPDDVKQNADGSWTIKSGARVRVRISMVAPSRRYHVALVDPLPAGLEALNPALAVTEYIPADTGNTGVIEYGSQSFGRGFYHWRWTWYEHQNLRDERAEAFASLLWEGVWNYSYVARATTPGEFVVPPAKAEEMYMPETFGRTGTDFVRVE
jgi:alpha-2-macroglobulin